MSYAGTANLADQKCNIVKKFILSMSRCLLLPTTVWKTALIVVKLHKNGHAIISQHTSQSTASSVPLQRLLRWPQPAEQQLQLPRLLAHSLQQRIPQALFMHPWPTTNSW